MAYKRYSIFPFEHGRGVPRDFTDAHCPIVLYMDESGNGNPGHPLVVGAVVVDSDASELEVDLLKLHRELSARRALRGHRGFEKFRKSGFHASTDPIEVSQPFIELIQRSVGFKIYLMASEDRTYRGLTEAQLISEMYERIVADNLIRHQGQNIVTVRIEENDGLRAMMQNLPRFANYRAITKLGKMADLPQAKIEVVKKGEFMSLAIVDYAMIAASRWIASGFTVAPDNRAFRGFREIAPVISFFYTMESGKLVSRKVGLAEL